LVERSEEGEDSHWRFKPTYGLHAAANLTDGQRQEIISWPKEFKSGNAGCLLLTQQIVWCNEKKRGMKKNRFQKKILFAFTISLRP